MHRAVLKVVPDEDFTLSVVFEDGREGTLDMKPYLDFGVFQRIRDYADFARVRVSFDTVEWECRVDLDPEFIYVKSQAASKT